MSECSPKMLEAKNFLYGLLNVNALPNADYLKFSWCPKSIKIEEDAIVISQEKRVDDAAGRGFEFHDILWQCDALACQVRDFFTGQPIQLLDRQGNPKQLSKADFDMAKRWLLANYIGK